MQLLGGGGGALRCLERGPDVALHRLDDQDQAPTLHEEQANRQTLPRGHHEEYYLERRPHGGSDVSDNQHRLPERSARGDAAGHAPDNDRGPLRGRRAPRDTDASLVPLMRRVRRRRWPVMRERGTVPGLIVWLWLPRRRIRRWALGDHLIVGIAHTHAEYSFAVKLQPARGVTLPRADADA